MPTTKLPDNGHTASQKIALQDNRKATDGTTRVLGPLNGRTPTTLHLHQQIHDALETTAFKKDAAGKSGEDLKLAVAAAISGGKVLVEVISVGLAEAAEAHASTPYEAIWTTGSEAPTERSYFDV